MMLRNVVYIFIIFLNYQFYLSLGYKSYEYWGIVLSCQCINVEIYSIVLLTSKQNDMELYTLIMTRLAASHVIP